MNTFSLSKTLSLVLLLMLVSTIVAFNINKPRIMVLHSYNTDYSWTRGVNIGLYRKMQGWTAYSIKWHYMDAKKRSDKEWLTRIGLVARRAIDKWEPHVLIAVDNLAHELAVQYYVDHPSINIVFAGINGPIEPYGYHEANNVTGILEQRQLKPLRDAILAMQSLTDPLAEQGENLRPIRLIYVHDASNSVLGDKDYIDNFPWSPIDYLGSVQANDYPTWQQTILNSAEHTDYIMVTNYRQLPRSATDPTFVPAQEVMEWTEKYSPVPVIGTQVFNVEDGGMLAIGISPFEQGEVAAELTQAIIRDNVSPHSLPIRPNQHFIVAMRKQQMVKRGVKLPDIYESFSRATNTHYE